MIPVRIAIKKLRNVPITTYSVSFVSLGSFKSPNLNTDLAANKKPTPSHFPNRMKIRIISLSRNPIHSPASFKDSITPIVFEPELVLVPGVH